MVSKAKRVHKWVTEPPINVLRDAKLTIAWTDAWAALTGARIGSQWPGESAVAFHKRKLGRQTFCWIDGDGRRRWVWNRALWRVYVHSEAGVAFEVPTTMVGRPEAIWEALKDYREKLGLEKL